VTSPHECPDGHGPMPVIESQHVFDGDATIYRCDTCGWLFGEYVRDGQATVMFEGFRPADGKSPE
jgi:hypothetical protein